MGPLSRKRFVVFFRRCSFSFRRPSALVSVGVMPLLDITNARPATQPHGVGTKHVSHPSSHADGSLVEIRKLSGQVNTLQAQVASSEMRTNFINTKVAVRSRRARRLRVAMHTFPPPRPPASCSTTRLSDPHSLAHS